MSKVILSRKTLDVLKNFSTINSSIVFRKGSTVRTISNAENILAKFTGEEVFPVDFAIYDLSQFLSGISLFSDPQLEFDNENFVSIRGGRQSARYFFSDPEITLKSAPEKNVKFPGSDLAVVSLLAISFLIQRLRSSLLQKKT
ncbi:DNA polymerase processivity factor [Synechococcus phage ACG-2014j]|uniref:Sliding clamp DNA polymerase n=1 Tax=Synechococcus phage ACG-2014j TaxID=1493514 RepID=A0A0E3FCN2_9CAUD|nr:DNA polymerase processivity factor [Synechococcus phage ACG-2014j]AIX24035.1 sliding clamp DNA polymerase [Synechococcus phage ACG-2014j]